jgi:hypothetical protein
VANPDAGAAHAAIACEIVKMHVMMEATMNALDNFFILSPDT